HHPLIRILGPAILVILTWYFAESQSGTQSVAASRGEASVAKQSQAAAQSPSKRSQHSNGSALEVTCVIFRQKGQETCVPSVTAKPQSAAPRAGKRPVTQKSAKDG